VLFRSFSSGRTLLWKVAQCGQVIDAYSTMVTLASGLPSARSGSGPGFISSSTGTSDGPRCASAPVLNGMAVAAPRATRLAERNSARRLTLAELFFEKWDKSRLLGSTLATSAAKNGNFGVRLNANRR